MAESKRYLRLKNLLLDKITGGDFVPGDRFFSQNELMKRYGLSFSTVMRALDELVREGYLVRRQGKGTYVEKIRQGSLPTAPASVKHLTVFAILPGQPGSGVLPRIDLSRFFIELEKTASPSMQMRLVPLSANAQDLEPYLFTHEPMDAVLFLFPSAAHLQILERMAQFCAVAVVTSGKPSFSENGPCAVVTDPAMAVQDAAQRLLAEGNQAIGMIINGQDADYAAAGVTAFRTVLRAAGLAYRESLVIHTGPRDPNGYHGALQLCDQNSDVKITGLLGVGPGIGLGVCFALQSMQLAADANAASEVNLVVCDDFTCTPETAVCVARVGFSPELLARSCTDALGEALRGRTNSAVTLAPEWLT